MAQPNYEEQIRGEIFLDPDEQYLCTAGTPQLERFLTKGKVGSGFAVLSDRAVYCKGKCSVSSDRSSYKLQETDYRIALEDFQGMKYLRKRNQVLLALAFFFLLLGPALYLLDKLTGFGARTVLNPTLDAGICLLLSGFCFLLFSIHRKTLLELVHSAGSIALDLRDLPQKEERLFVRYLRAYLNARTPAQE